MNHVRPLLTILLGLFVWLSPCGAQSTEHRETAFTSPAGAWSVGLFNPLQIQLTDDWGVETHPIAFLGAPHVDVSHRWRSGKDWALTGYYGLSIPSWALRFEPPFGLRGYLSPKCVVSQAEPERNLDCGQDAWVIVPKIGTAYSRGTKWVITAEADISAGWVLSGERPRPLDSYAPVEVAFAPMTHDYRVHLGGRMSGRITPWLITMAEFDVYRVGQIHDRSPWILSLYTGVDILFTDHLRGTLGVIYWNHDQRAMVLREDEDGFSRKEMVRSHDAYPTLDLIWTY